MTVMALTSFAPPTEPTPVAEAAWAALRPEAGAQGITLTDWLAGPSTAWLYDTGGPWWIEPGDRLADVYAATGRYAWATVLAPATVTAEPAPEAPPTEWPEISDDHLERIIDGLARLADWPDDPGVPQLVLEGRLEGWPDEPRRAYLDTVLERGRLALEAPLEGELVDTMPMLPPAPLRPRARGWRTKGRAGRAARR